MKRDGCEQFGKRLDSRFFGMEPGDILTPAFGDFHHIVFNFELTKRLRKRNMYLVARFLNCSLFQAEIVASRLLFRSVVFSFNGAKREEMLCMCFLRGRHACRYSHTVSITAVIFQIQSIQELNRNI